MIIDELKSFLLWAAFSPGSRFFWVYLLVYLLLGIALFKYNQDAAGDSTTLAGSLFPGHIYSHPSFAMDIKMFVLFYVLGRLGLFTFVIYASTHFATLLVSMLESSFSGWASATGRISMTDRIIFTLVVILVFDLAYFLVHLSMHEFRILWVFHQVHHAAEHLTPLTSARFHPVDYIITYFVQTLMTTMAVTLFTLIKGAEVQLITILNVSAVLFGFHILSNFRHSHIWMSFGPTISKAFVSPCMHQVHHSQETRHVNRNYGLIFSVWDRIAGSRYIPVERESFELGVRNGKLHSSDSIWRHLYLPVIQAWQLMCWWRR